MAEIEERPDEQRLKLLPPEGDKSFMISFIPHDDTEAEAYSYAIDKVLRAQNLNPFLQSHDREDVLSEQRWETLFQGRSDILRQKIEAALPQIETEAREYIDIINSLG